MICQRTYWNCNELDNLKKKDILEMSASIFETQTTSGKRQPHNKVQKTHSLSRCILKATFMKSQKS